ncbi:hypothetical protein [Streptomyces sp. NPDC052042]|uniref:hypothetical protein n=1 Tax=Streptomyces sp. NPDC052042 TaxID=3365683 RepID=UPI0037D3D787
MIAVVGHRDLDSRTLELVETEIKARLDSLAEGVAALVRVGAGLPLVFGRTVRAAGRKLTVLLPAQGAVPAVLPERDRQAAGELLVLAEDVRLLAFDPADRDACVGADERVVATCRSVLAVWDGSPSDGRDATAHLVAFARARGIHVDVVWPDGCARRRPA